MKYFKSQSELFNYIWETREKISELTGKPLLSKSHFKWHWQFLHLLSKGTYPKYKLNEKNIILGLPEEHEKQETFKIFKDKQTKLKLEYYNKYYNNIKQIK